MAFRALGHKRVRLPLSTPAFEETLSGLEQAMEGAETVDLGFLGWQAHRLDLAPYGYPAQVFLRPMGAFTQFLAQQYRCPKDDGSALEVEAGDVVIDAGGCFGDTALYFAHKAGPEGKVFSFEFVPDNLTIFRRNMAMNPELASRVQVVESPLWSTSGETMYIEGRGPATRVSPTPRTADAQPMFTLTIDDLVRGAGLERVDFIKMDIEGAEQAALKGAEETLRTFRPKLGLSVYHRLEDFGAIYRFVDGLGLGYRFYLRHFTMHAEETILFAEPI
jgi:FkbM family methyltransferase